VSVGKTFHLHSLILLSISKIMLNSVGECENCIFFKIFSVKGVVFSYNDDEKHVKL